MQRQEALLSTREKTGQWWHGDTGGPGQGVSCAVAGVIHEQDVGLNGRRLPRTSARTARFITRKGDEQTRVGGAGEVSGYWGSPHSQRCSERTGAPTDL